MSDGARRGAAAGSAPAAGGAKVRLGPGREFDLIRGILAREDAATPEWLLVPPGDDCAVVDAGPLALSCDLAVEDVHFRRAWLAPEEIGWRAAAAALSDLAASAARPLGILVSLGLPGGMPSGEARRVSDGARAAAGSVGARLLGGDVTRSPGPLLLDVVAVGRASEPALRGGAEAGDEVWVTGRLGGAGAAVRAWEAGGEPAPGLREAFARPHPRTEEALWLAREVGLRALIDLSDGLAGDAGHLAAASGVRIVLEEARIPLHPDLPTDPERLRRALSDGDDYELCLVVARGAIDREVSAAFRERFDLRLARVGRVEEGEGAVLEDEAGRRLPAGGGHDHLREGGGVARAPTDPADDADTAATPEPERPTRSSGGGGPA